jgi:hypothetical protein
MMRSTLVLIYAFISEQSSCTEAVEVLLKAGSQIKEAFFK